MYFVNVLAKPDQQILIAFFWSKGKAKLKEYYKYFLIFKGDYRWLLVFIIGRLPWGRTLGKFFYSDREAKGRFGYTTRTQHKDSHPYAQRYALEYLEGNHGVWRSPNRHLTAEQSYAKERNLSIFQDLKPEVVPIVVWQEVIKNVNCPIFF